MRGDPRANRRRVRTAESPASSGVERDWSRPDAGALPRSRAEVLRMLGATVATTLDGCTAEVRRVVLLDYPEYDNVGDSAIWVATREFLRSRRIKVDHVASRRLYDRRAVRRHLGKDTVILLSGGGNFGDLWPEHQLLREAVVADFDDARIVQLPQSLHFDDHGAKERSLARLAAHPRLLVLARDRRTHETLSKAGLSTQLCPDVVHLLQPRIRAVAGDGVVTIARSDLERASGLGGYEAGWQDWVQAPRDVPEQLRRTISGASRLLRLSGGADLALWRRAGEPLARARLDRGLRLIDRHHTVVTDRLHAVLLGVMSGRRVLASDNSYGKVFGYLDTWSDLAPLVERVADLRTGTALAHS